MVKYKSNHYVPQWLLNNFKDENNNLFYWSKDHPEQPIRHRNPTSVFCKNHLYTIIEKDGTRDTNLEAVKYNKLDGLSKIVFEKIISQARTTRKFLLTPHDREICTYFLYNQMRRTPEFMTEVAGSKYLDDTLEEILSNLATEIEGLPSLVREQRESEINRIRSNEAFKQRIFQYGKVNVLKQDSLEILDIIWNRFFAIIRPEKHHHSFLIGSRPVLRLSFPDRPHLSEPTLEIVMPISHDFALISVGVHDVERIVNYPTNAVRYLNELTFRQSTEIAGKSLKLISSISGRYASP